MEYTINKLAVLSGVTSRTLRYYDEIGLLKPARISSSGYRIYGAIEVDKLQQILFYRELEVSLDQINELISSNKFDEKQALQSHYQKLIEKREQLDILIENVEKSIALKEGRITMSDKEKFEGLKRKKVEENEKKYGKEIREKYGNQAVDESNAKVLGMTQDDQNRVEWLANEIINHLLKAMENGDPRCNDAQKAVALHKEWLCYYWESYTKEAHSGIGNMYVHDERFRKYYNQHKEGMAEFLRDAIDIYVKNA